jgi:hypothetical protein
MHQYIRDTRYAAEGLVGLMARDAADYEALKEQHKCVFRPNVTGDFAKA